MSLNPQCYFSNAAVAFPPTPILEGDHRADVCIVGAGIAGSTAALQLAATGLSVRVIDAYPVGFGASGRSGGNLIPGCPMPAFPKSRGSASGSDNTAEQSSAFRAAWDAGVDGARTVRSLIETHNIDCDFVPSGHLRVATSQRHVRDLERMAELMQSFGHKDLLWYDRAAIGDVMGSYAFSAGLLDPLGGHLNPTKFSIGLANAARAKGAVFYENTPYISHSIHTDGSVIVVTPWSRLAVRWLLITGNTFLWERYEVPDNSTLPLNTYMVATDQLEPDIARTLIPGNQSVSDLHVSSHRFRMTEDKRIIMGGVLTGARIDPFNVHYALLDQIRRYFPTVPKETTVTHAWGGQVGMTRNRLPHFGRLDRQVLFAHGFGRQGIGMAAFAGATMAEAIRESESRFDVMSAIPHAPYPSPRQLYAPITLLGLTKMRIDDLIADFEYKREVRRAEKAAR